MSDKEGLILPGDEKYQPPSDMILNQATREMEKKLMDALFTINRSSGETRARFKKWKVRRHRRSIVIPQMLEVMKAILEFSERAHNDEFDRMMQKAAVFFDAQQQGLVAWMREEIKEAEKMRAEATAEETTDVDRNDADGDARDEGSGDLSGRGETDGGSGTGEDQED